MSHLLFGYTGYLLRLNLTQHKTSIESTNPGFLIRYIGGKGLGARILIGEAELQKDPLDSSSPLILSTGPANGLSLSGAAKFCAVFKSPLTGIWGESQCGGYFGPPLKFAGYDAIIVQGRSEKPIYVLINDGDVEIKSAEHLWGRDIFETEDTIKKDDGRSLQVLAIGPAGENLVRYACIGHDKGRELGRCGGGAVMGSKNLKAIAVRGTRKMDTANPEEFNQFRTKLNQLIVERLNNLREYGTPGVMSLVDTTGSLPTRNWTEGHFEDMEKIGPVVIRRTIMKRSKACFARAHHPSQL